MNKSCILNNKNLNISDIKTNDNRKEIIKNKDNEENKKSIDYNKKANENNFLKNNRNSSNLNIIDSGNNKLDENINNLNDINNNNEENKKENLNSNKSNNDNNNDDDNIFKQNNPNNCAFIEIKDFKKNNNNINKNSNNEFIIDSKNNDENDKDNNNDNENSKKNDFFINDYNNCVCVNIDNNTDYGESDLQELTSKQAYYSNHINNILNKKIKNNRIDSSKINLYNDNNQEINKKNFLNKKTLEIKVKDSDDEGDKKIEISELLEKRQNFKDSQITEGDKSEQERKKSKIYYKIIKKINLSHNRSLEKNSLDGSIDEIISRELIKIHNTDLEKKKNKIDKAFNLFQEEKSHRLTNFNIYNNYNLTNENNINGIKKSKSADKIKGKIPKEMIIFQKKFEKVRNFDVENIY